ncbi:energy transducer TonB [Ancylomarina salipaludis]|uniref:Energy transducer TonB n=1 Tax=Ancylomarina salipaludis TaxID=2501299 RepID=A0A4Q1JKU4_9BACT|nr:energy transducer TonB [Ancylomarina salipaludis]RXQ93936.1 energy transducer TonB [Ancylomarina salipaludis]
MKSFFFLVAFVFLFQFGYTQNDTTIYYKANNKPAIGKEDATRYIEIKKKKKNEFKVDSYIKSDNIWEQSHEKRVIYLENDSLVKIKDDYSKKMIYRKYKHFNKGYLIKDYNESGKIIAEGLSRTLLVTYWEGQVKEYYSSGRLASISKYKNNQVLMNKNWLENGEPYIDNIFDEVDVMPEFPGGMINLMKYFSTNIKYPEEARMKGVEGRVFVSFVVDIDGKVIGAYIKKSQHSLFNEEALRVVSEMANWSAGKLDGKPVKVGYTLPVNFRLR